MHCVEPTNAGAGRRSAWGGFTLVELLVAMTITVILGMVVVLAYNTSMQAYYRTEKQFQALAAFRNTADRLEREVNSMVFKSSVWEWPYYERDSWCGMRHAMYWETRIKYLNGDPTLPNPGNSVVLGDATKADWKIDPSGRSMYQINFRPRYLGYYSTPDGFVIDRTEWYFNPPEDKLLWNNGLDDDDDDPDGDAGLRTLYDDRGCLMMRKKFDKDMCWAEWYDPAVMPAPRLGSSNINRVRPNDFRDPYHGPYSRADFPPKADELAGPLTGDQLAANGDLKLGGTPLTLATYSALSREDKRKAHIESGYIVDTGTVIGENFSDLRFYYLYKHHATDRFVYADWWPWDDDSDPTSNNGKDLNLMYYDGDTSKPIKSIGVVAGGTVHAPDWTGWCALCGAKTGGCKHGVANAPAPRCFDISYFTLPLAISVKFTFTVGRQNHVYEKMIFLHASRWLQYLNP